MKKVCLALILVLGILTLVGCGRANDTNADPYLSKSATQAVVVLDTAGDRDMAALDKTIQSWVKGKINGKFAYLSDNQPDLVATKAAIEGFNGAYRNADYRTFDGAGMAAFLSNTLLKTFNDERWAPLTKKYYADYQIMSRLDEIKMLNAAFNKDYTVARIDAIVYLTYTAGNKETLANRVQIGQQYGQVNSYWLVKVDNVWQIEQIKEGQLTLAENIK